MATSAPVEAVSWIAPCQASDSPVRRRSQPTTTSSTSVSAGADCQVMPRAPSPDEAMSPSTEASEAFDGNQPKKAGLWVWVMPGHHDPVEVGEHLGERLGLLGGFDGERGRHLAGLDPRRDRQVRNPLAVVGDPVDQLVGGGAELLGSHGATVRPAADTHRRTLITTRG